MEPLQHQVLDFPMPDDSFDPNFTPEDGTQYLQQVVHERKHCPTIVVKPFVNNIANQPPSWTLLEAGIVDTAPAQLRPSKEWKKLQITEFSSIRQRISAMREQFRLNPPDNLPKLPTISDPKPWFDYCKNNSPVLRIMLQIDQRMLEVLLDYQLKWLDESTTKNGLDLVTDDSWLGTWIYSTLSCLHLPLEPDTHSMLRQIAKCCVSARNRLTADDVVKATPFNLLICIISSCFDQMDFKSLI